jgi:hypothetical protein
MTKPKTTQGKIENALGGAREKLAAMRGFLEELAATSLDKSLETAVLDVDKVDQEIALALSLLEDADIIDEVQDHTEHVFRALKHLGVQDLDAFTDADVKMALEQTEGL